MGKAASSCGAGKGQGGSVGARRHPAAPRGQTAQPAHSTPLASRMGAWRAARQARWKAGPPPGAAASNVAASSIVGRRVAGVGHWGVRVSWEAGRVAGTDVWGGGGGLRLANSVPPTPSAVGLTHIATGAGPAGPGQPRRFCTRDLDLTSTQHPPRVGHGSWAAAAMDARAAGADDFWATPHGCGLGMHGAHLQPKTPPAPPTCAPPTPP